MPDCTKLHAYVLNEVRKLVSEYVFLPFVSREETNRQQPES